jgi:3',5'-cyclic AMP phosphodiesterase CpdA
MSSESKIVARLIHLSDLHFGFDGPDAVWDKLVSFVKELEPSVILITGDIVNTPKKALFEEAILALKQFGSVPLLVCPGNHDRHFFGNAIGKWNLPFAHDFYYYLRQWYVEAPKFKVIDLGPKLTARITAIDSSDQTSFFARSYVGKETLEALKGCGSAAPNVEEVGKLNLRIVMTHHHLLPIRALEGKKDRLIGPFQSATTLTVNAGTVLAELSESHVDLVLHGHEHVNNVAKYSTLDNRLGNVTIVAAGSSTGTVTAKGWHFASASFNVLEVHDDESIWLSMYRGKDKTFSMSEHHKLFEAVDLRRAHFFRSNKTNESDAQGLKIHFRFLENRDAIVHRSYFNASLTADCFTFTAYSDTGKPFDPKVWLLDDDGNRTEGDVGNGFAVASHTQYAWECTAKFPPQRAQSPHHVVTSYRWQGAAVFSRAHVDALPPEVRGPLYSRYLEHAYSGVPAGMKTPASLEMSVDLPERWAPDDIRGHIQVFTKRKSDKAPTLSASLTKAIYSNGEGHISLRVNYPESATRYYLAWRVRDAARF